MKQNTARRHRGRTALLTAAMLMAMLLMTVLRPTVHAAEIPTDADRATATVQNVEAGATVMAYQITEAVYNANGFIRYKAVDGVTIADPTAPTSDEVGAIAQNAAGLTAVPMTQGADGSYTAELGAGYWMVLVEGTGDTIYNPMLVGVYYSVSGSDNTMTSDPVDADSSWALETENAYAKKDTPKVDKIIELSGSGNISGDDVAVGDTVHFAINTTIPSYSPQYTTVVFDIKDTLSAGLTSNQDAVVTVGGQTVSAPDVTVTYSGQNMTVSFSSDYILANGLKDVKVTYTAVLNDSAGINFDANTNTATLSYTHNPGEVKDGDSDTTYTYTFGIDASLNGAGSDTTNEITKTGTTSSTQTTQESLAGAAFTLTNNATGKVYTATSDSAGQLSFTGLDAGSYTLVETEAPAGYTLNDETHAVVISASYNADGTLNSYSITIDGTATSTYTATYAADGTVTTIDKTEQGTEIQNTSIAELPSTGGPGTVLLTVLGLGLMAAAVLVLREASRKNRSDSAR